MSNYNHKRREEDLQQKICNITSLLLEFKKYIPYWLYKKLMEVINGE